MAAEDVSSGPGRRNFVIKEHGHIFDDQMHYFDLKNTWSAVIFMGELGSAMTSFLACFSFGW